MKKTISMFATLMLLALMSFQTAFAQTAPANAPPPDSPQAKAADLLKQGRQLHSQGKFDEAIGVYNKAMAIAPDYYDVHAAIGSALDLKGQYAEARKHLQKAIDLADADHKPGTLRSMAISYAFERNAKEEAKYGWQAYQLLLDAKKPTDAAGALNELARLELESGAIDAAARDYQAGCAVGAKAAATPAEGDLWQFRVQHAFARIAARRGQKDEAQKRVAAAQAIFDKKTLPEGQAVFVPYLTGYVAFYGGDFKTALSDLQKADQKDPFILALLAQTEEKLGDKTAAKDYWTKVMGIYSHNPTNAFARPLAKKALGM